MNANGKTPGKCATPAKIVFESWRDGNGEIYIMNADGSSQKNLTRKIMREMVPQLGRQLVIKSHFPGGRKVFIL